MHVFDLKFMRDKNDFRVIHAQFYVNGNTGVVFGGGGGGGGGGHVIQRKRGSESFWGKCLKRM